MNSTGPCASASPVPRLQLCATTLPALALPACHFPIGKPSVLQIFLPSYWLFLFLMASPVILFCFFKDYFMCMNLACMYVSASRKCLELELEMVWGHHVCAGNQTPAFCKSSKYS